MKKIGLLCCCCLLMAFAFSSLKAASLEVVSADTLRTIIAGDQNRIYAYANVKNISASTVNVIVGLSIIEKTEGQQIQVCFAGGCMEFFPPASDPERTDILYDVLQATLAPGETTDGTGNDFDCLISNKTTIGETIVLFNFKNAANQKDAVSTTIKYVVTATGIESEEIGKANGASVYPNPARTAFTIDHGAVSGTINIFSATGAKVAQRAIESGSLSTSVETADMTPGTYFFTITSAGEKISSGKFQVVK